MNRTTTTMGWGLWAGVALLGIGVAVLAAPVRIPAQGDMAEPWGASIQKVDAALARGEYGSALRAANDAYAAALAERRWEGIVAAGDAYRRMGERTGLRRTLEAKAREAYVAALTRARQESAVDGVLVVAEAFLTLGDGEMAAQCVRIAGRLAGRDPEAQASIRAFSARLAP